MPDTKPPPSLNRELDAIESHCRDSAQSGPSGLRLCRTVRGMNREQWRRIKEELGLEAWHAEPLEADSGLSLHGFLRVEMERTRSCQHPLALAFIRPETGVESVLNLVRTHLRCFDHVSLFDERTIAICLTATPLVAAERVVGALLRRIRQGFGPDQLCSAGLVGYGGLARIDTGELLDTAHRALHEAARLGGNRLEVAPSADAALASRETLVRASEKHFLFTGKQLPDTQDGQ